MNTFTASNNTLNWNAPAVESVKLMHGLEVRKLSDETLLGLARNCDIEIEALEKQSLQGERTKAQIAAFKERKDVLSNAYEDKERIAYQEALDA